MTKKTLEGKVVLITGAAAGIGAGCARALAAEGAHVVLTDIDGARVQQTAESIRGSGGHAEAHQQDVTDEARWVEIAAQVEQRHGRLDGLVANAGIGIGAPMVEMTLADWRKTHAVNVEGVFLSCKHTIPAMLRTGSGSVVLMSSVAGMRGAAGLSAYSASKGAVRLFGKSLAIEYGPKIRVNTVHPGIIDTEIWAKIPADAENSRGKAPMDPHEIARHFAPLTRSGTPDDIAQAVLWLLSDASSYVSGIEMVVDGAMTAGGFFKP